MDEHTGTRMDTRTAACELISRGFAPIPAKPRSLPVTVRDWADEYRSRGLSITRIRTGEKRPTDFAWTTRSADPSEFQDGDSIGVLAGWLSDYNCAESALVIIDLDSTQAIERADDFLPETTMTEGRAGKPRAHRYFLIPVKSIPLWAESKAAQSAEAARKADRHPGPFKKQFRDAANKIAIDFLGSGAHATAPPSRHASGELREWEHGVCGVPAEVTFDRLWASVCRLAAAIGCERPSDCEIAPGFDDAPTRCLVHGQPDRNSCVARSKFGATKHADGILRATQPDVDQVQRLARAAKYLAAIPEGDLSRTGAGGHNTLFRHVSTIANGFGIEDGDLLLSLFTEHYNQRIEHLSRSHPDDGFEVWSDKELRHKISGAIDAGPPPGKESGWLLNRDSAELPMAWDNPARLSRGLGEVEFIRFLGDTAYQYTQKCWGVLPDSGLKALMQTHIEREATAAFTESNNIWFTQVRDLASIASVAQAQRSVKAVQPGMKEVPKVTQRTLQDALGSFRAANRLPEKTPFDVHLADQQPRDWLRVKNGILDLGTQHLGPHSAEWFSLASLPVEFDSGSPPPRKWLEFLAKVLQGDADRISLIQEIFGWCLDRGSNVQAFAMFVGPGANGKSVCLHVLRSLLGVANCSSVALNQLCGSTHRFAAHGLLGKLANIKGDQSYIESSDESAIKELTGGDLYQFEAKGKQPIYAVNRAKLIFGVNQMPTFSDKSEGVWRRLVPVPFDVVIPESKQNPAMMNIEYWADELPGILNWALEGLARLRVRGRFELPPACRALHAQHREDSNPARRFLLENYIETESDCDRIASSEIFVMYKSWCSQNGFDQPLISVKLGREIPKAFPKAKNHNRRLNGTMTRIWTGLRRINVCDGYELFPRVQTLA